MRSLNQIDTREAAIHHPNRLNLVACRHPSEGLSSLSLIQTEQRRLRLERKRILMNTPTSIRIAIAALLLSFSNQGFAEQTAKRFEIQRSLDYLLFLPQNYDEKAAHPLIVFLHGAGERGDNIEVVKVHGPPKIVQSKPDFPFIVLSPQCPKNQRWNALDLMDLIKHIKSKYKVDAERIYLTGLSMGGYGTWDLAAQYPYEFAAIAPICGGGNPRNTRRMGHIPTWVFHGGKDTVVPISQSEGMIAGMEKAGGTPKFTIYPDAGHDSWTATYNNPELYEWFLEHRKQEPPKGRR